MAIGFYKHIQSNSIESAYAHIDWLSDSYPLLAAFSLVLSACGIPCSSDEPAGEEDVDADDD